MLRGFPLQRCDVSCGDSGFTRPTEPDPHLSHPSLVSADACQDISLGTSFVFASAFGAGDGLALEGALLVGVLIEIMTTVSSGASFDRNDFASGVFSSAPEVSLGSAEASAAIAASPEVSSSLKP